MERTSDRTARVLIAGAIAIAGLVLAAGPGTLLAQEDPDRPLRPSGRILPERAEVDLVLIDVVVRTRKGRPATGLIQKDFQLLIDRLPAPIESFESYCAGISSADGEVPPPPPTLAAAPAEPRHVILFFDINHLTKRGKDRSLDAALDYVRDQKRPGDRVMILVMKGQPMVAEEFTADGELLARRLLEIRADNEMLDMSVLEEALNVFDILEKDCSGAASCQSRRRAAALPYAIEEANRTRRSLQALRNLMPALSVIRGRKTIVHFSETFRDEPGLQYLILASTTPEAEGIDVTKEIQDLHREANAAGVALYPVWATGLGEGSGVGPGEAGFRLNLQQTVQLEQSRLAGEDAALALGTTLALETGGQALRRTNEIGRIFPAVNEDLNCYYVLGYRNIGPGDGKRHSIIVKVNRKRHKVRHRPYYEDWSESERLDRKFRSALLAPAFFREVPVVAEAYPLAPEKKKIPVLFKVEFPLAEITLVPQADGFLYGEAEVRGTVWTGSKESCRFSRRIPLEIEPGEAAGDRRVVYEAGCDLPPGEHVFTAAVVDSATWTLGAAEILVRVSPRRAGILGDVMLWTSSAGDHLVAGDAAAVGIHVEGSGHGFIPRATRRFGLRETGILYVVVCPPASQGGAPVQVQRTLFAGEREVASYPAASLEGGGSCQGFFSPIRPGQLGPGGFVLEVRVEGITQLPMVHRAGFALGDGTADQSNP